jgi:hypothetical protein
LFKYYFALCGFTRRDAGTVGKWSVLKRFLLLFRSKRFLAPFPSVVVDKLQQRIDNVQLSSDGRAPRTSGASIPPIGGAMGFRNWFRRRFVFPPFQPGEPSYNRFHGTIVSTRATADKRDAPPPDIWIVKAERARGRTESASRQGEQLVRLLIGLIQFALVAVGLVPLLPGFFGVTWWFSAPALVLLVACVGFSLNYLQPRLSDSKQCQKALASPTRPTDWRANMYLEELFEASFREHSNLWIARNLFVPACLVLAALGCISIAIAMSPGRPTIPTDAAATTAPTLGPPASDK